MKLSPRSRMVVWCCDDFFQTERPDQTKTLEPIPVTRYLDRLPPPPPSRQTLPSYPP